MQKVKSILIFFLFYLGIFCLHIVTSLFLSSFLGLLPYYFSDLELQFRIIISLFVLLIVILLGLILLIICKILRKNSIDTIINKIRTNFIKIFLMMFCIVGFIDIILIMCIYLAPLIYYYIFKKYFNNNSLIVRFFLDFNSVKKYFITILLLDLPFLIFSLYSIFPPESDVSFLGLFGALSNSGFYTVIMIANLIDNLKQNKSKP